MTAQLLACFGGGLIVAILGWLYATYQEHKIRTQHAIELKDMRQSAYADGYRIGEAAGYQKRALVSLKAKA